MTIDASTVAIALSALAVVGSAAGHLAAELAPTSPRAALACRVVAALSLDVRAAVLAFAAPSLPARKDPPS